MIAKGFAGVAQLVEHQPSKLRVAGSNPVSRYAAVAQSVERILGKDEVISSILIVGSMVRRAKNCSCNFLLAYHGP